MASQESAELSENCLAKNYKWSPNPILKNGIGCWLYDINGEKYLDMISCYSASSFGHGHPRLIKAAHEQLDTGLTVSARVFLTDELKQFAKELVAFCGMKDAMMLPMNTGAEAVDSAIKVVRKWGYTVKEIPLDQAEIIFCEDNFHGRTLGAISASTVDQYKKFFGPLLPQESIKIIKFGNTVSLEQAITKNTVAFFVEPIQGEGGINVPPAKYLDRAKRLCEKHNVLLVCDEVQTGFGRTGRMFACDHDNMRPDLLILGKALGGGIVPISAVVGRRDVLEVFQPGDHGSTFGGNPFACRVAREALRVLREDEMDYSAATKGRYFKTRLRVLAQRFEFIKEVRGLGLLIGVEFTGSVPAQYVCEELVARRVLAAKAKEHVLRLSPPLTISVSEIDFAMERLEDALKNIRLFSSVFD